MGKPGIPQKAEWFRQQLRSFLSAQATADSTTAFIIMIYSVMHQEGLGINDVKTLISAELGQTVDDEKVSDIILACKPRHITGNRCQSCGGSLTGKPLTHKGVTICKTPEVHEVPSQT